MIEPTKADRTLAVRLVHAGTCHYRAQERFGRVDPRASTEAFLRRKIALALAEARARWELERK